MRYLPILLGVVLVEIARAVSGWTGSIWLCVGLFFGGWVPLYLMPWLRSRRR